MVQKAASKLLSADVYEAIRSDILSGRRDPGSRIKIAAVAAQFAVSLSVVREALTRLAQHGLVTAEPNQGFSVIPLSRQDLLDLTWTRVNIEGLAIYESVGRGDITWEAAVISAHHILERTLLVGHEDPNRVLDPWATAHASFHNSLMEGCGRPRLIDIAEMLRDAAELYRRWSVPFATGGTRDIAAEHRGILEAVLSRDPETARQRLVAHIQETTNVLLAMGEPG
jgi:DNA-binding GntR family transcriptional regulator